MRKYSDEERLKIFRSLQKYTEEHNPPLLSGFCKQEKIPIPTVDAWQRKEDTVMDGGEMVNLDWSHEIKKLQTYCQHYFEELVFKKPNLMTYCIFWLKAQAQWRDSDSPKAAIEINNQYKIPSLAGKSDRELQEISQRFVRDGNKYPVYANKK